MLIRLTDDQELSIQRMPNRLSITSFVLTYLLNLMCVAHTHTKVNGGVYLKNEFSNLP